MNSNPSGKNPLKENFLKNLHSHQQLELLFEHLPDVHFFAKDAEGRFVMANDLFVKQCGVRTEADIIGRNDYDFFPTDRAHQYCTDDANIMATGKCMINKVEPAPEKNKAMNWFVTTKVPLYSHDNKIIGIAGIARDINRAHIAIRPYAELSSVIQYINKNYDSPITVKDMAKTANLSVSQFERKFIKVFGSSPLQYLLDVRIKAACRLLSDTNMKISTIAQQTGFYDNSHLTRQFIKTVGMNPKAYRQQYA